jgi:dTDP-4-dehydrorhamnose 3,5-epimerase
VIFEQCHIPDVIKITPKRHGDGRGHFVELFRADLFKSKVGDVSFVQHNQSLSRPVGTVRGLHYQVAPAAQGKLVRCVRGAILDVAVDIRRSSPTFGQHVAVELSADTDAQLWIPEGFAHGFCTLTPDTEVWYAVTHIYSPTHERGLLWNDPELGIDWPVTAESATVGPRDAVQPRFHEFAADFA